MDPARVVSGACNRLSLSAQASVDERVAVRGVGRNGENFYPRRIQKASKLGPVLQLLCSCGETAKQLTEHDAVEIRAVGVCDDIDHLGCTKHERCSGIGVEQNRAHALLPELGANLIERRCGLFERDALTLTPTPRKGVEVVMAPKSWFDPLMAQSLRDEAQYQGVDARVFPRGTSFQLGKRLCVKTTDAEVCHDILVEGKVLSKMLPPCHRMDVELQQ